MSDEKLPQIFVSQLSSRDATCGYAQRPRRGMSVSRRGRRRRIRCSAQSRLTTVTPRKRGRPRLVPQISPARKKAKIVRFSTEELTWDCWQCFKAFPLEDELARHLLECNKSTHPLPLADSLLGCPFCPRDGCHTSSTPYLFGDFNAHLQQAHPDVEKLFCSICLEETSASLQALTHHIIFEHRVYWRPSPASLVYLRQEDVAHRVVTCLGCGWCSFDLRSTNTVQPPVSLSSHLGRCARRGAQVVVERLPERIDAELVTRLLEAAMARRDTFHRRFSGVCGFSWQPIQPPLPPLLKYAAPTRREDSTSHQGLHEVSSALLPREVLLSKTVEDEPKWQSRFAPKGIFDVPLELPPPPPQGFRTSRRAPSRLYVCPICGDNALNSLRERDEHLQNEHNGELVFPCQLCGLVYPLYIALRRHAVLKHMADFDAVLYGQLESEEALECPHCDLVSFSSPEVLELHLARLHPQQHQQQVVVAAVASTLDPADDDINDEDWTDTKSPERKPRGRRGGGCHRMAYGSSSCLDETDILEGVEMPVRRRRGTRRPRQRGTVVRRPLSGRARGRPRRNPLPNGGVLSPPSGPGLHIPNAITGVPLEEVLLRTSGQHAPVCCRFCGPLREVHLDNEKELLIHFECEHNPSSAFERLGCQSCGRIFFDGTDLINHFRVAHQAEMSVALDCPNREPVNICTEDGGCDESSLTMTGGGCPAKFTSLRLRDSHLAADPRLSPQWACPLQLEAELFQAFSGPLSNIDGFDLMLLATEIAADAAGVMILAYGCPVCSRIFTGENATPRYLMHRSECLVSIDGV